MPEVPSFSLAGKVVVQFGGTGLLGRALVTSLASAGATLVVTSRNRDSLAELAAAEHAAGRLGFEPLSADHAAVLPAKQWAAQSAAMARRLGHPPGAERCVL